ncbi:SLC13 family permease [Salinicola endophyticus]|uniref:SLC13 family permease n=1 Tax=Salinicola endophyticus TaxID=1949083 RepID=A0ABY8FIK9_9GAMM|nr:SLC13 family permease [Salinicola endophyticus]WFF42648.1 SLC13 family permease [Salinicola endophyticus]
MGIDAWLSIAAVVAVLGTLVFTRIAPDAILVGAMAFLIFTDVLTPQQALAGFANTGVMTIAALYVVAAALKETGAIKWIASLLLGQPSTLRRAQWRVMLPASVLSAFMNNTTVVAMFIPAIQDWSGRLRLPPSKLLLPLSYISILGGTCTLIGTSTNLVVDGLLQSRQGISLGMFELTWVGLPILIVGGGFILLFAGWLLPQRDGTSSQLDQIREYSVEVDVKPGGPLVGRSIAEAGLRNLQFGYLTDIQRGGELLAAVPPETRLQADDTLIFVGAPECARELREVRGLVPTNGNVQKLEIAHHRRCLVEAVISPDFTAIGQSVRESRFRSRFQAVILSISRHGRRLEGKLGDVEFQVGDTLLLETGQQFVEQYRYRKDFLLVSQLNDSTPPNFQKAPLSLGILGVMVLLSATNLTSILEAAFLAAGAMLVSGCLTMGKARRYIDLSVLIVIAASFSLGTAMSESGAAQAIAEQVVGQIHTPWLALLFVYVMTVLFTEMITNNAAAVLMFPIAMAVSDQLGVDFMPFVIAVTIAASASFMTALGYQTNLMVMGPGGYRMHDYLKLGVPLSLIVGVVSVTMIPLIWHF